MIDLSVEFTRGNYELAIHTLFEGAVPGGRYCLLVPARLRTTIIAAISLPLSIFPGFLGDGSFGLFAQPREPACDYALDRRSRRRCHRRGREHRAPHSDGQIRLSGRHRGRRRDRARRHRHQPDHRRDLCSRKLHVGNRRAIFQTIRHYRLGAGAVFASGRASDHADARGLLLAVASAQRAAAGAAPSQLLPRS